ncbi:MAG: Maf-like protein [Proteobacteria bacterium]|nr:Maf-like protein [Pseudomonadota bacterium]
MVPNVPLLVLASGSNARRQLLSAAGVSFRIITPEVDESELRRSLQADGIGSTDAAVVLAEAKARQVSNCLAHEMVPPQYREIAQASPFIIGADQILDCEGVWFAKPPNLVNARTQLNHLRGRWHELVTAVSVLQDGICIWHHVERSRLRMRDFSDAFREHYLEDSGKDALRSVGVYRLEGLGVQLFAQIEGDYFAILGLPLLPLLEFLRVHGAVSR